MGAGRGLGVGGDFVCPGVVLSEGPPVVLVPYFLGDSVSGERGESFGGVGVVVDAGAAGGVIQGVDRLLPVGADVILEEVASTQHADRQEHGGDGGRAAASSREGHRKQYCLSSWMCTAVTIGVGAGRSAPTGVGVGVRVS